MSLTTKRQEFTAALSTVEGVQGYDYKPTTPRAGDAWPQWRGMSRSEEVQFTNAWVVVVYLPQDERSAEQWVEEHIAGLYDAINPVAFIDGFSAANLSQTGQQYGLVISTRSE